MVKELGALKSSSADLILFMSLSTSARVLSKLFRAFTRTHVDWKQLKIGLYVLNYFTDLKPSMK